MTKGQPMSPKAPAPCGVLTARGVLLVFVLALGALLVAGCGGSQDEADIDVPASPEEATNVVVRVSGTEGVAYSGNYGTLEGPAEIVDDAIGAEPTDYEIEVQEGGSDGVFASFRKTEPGQGELRVQTVADEKVVVESRTLAELGAADVAWLPQEMGSSEGPPPEEVMMLEDDMILPEEEDSLGEEGPPEPVEVTSEG
jgi:hypothetical protein